MALAPAPPIKLPLTPGVAFPVAGNAEPVLLPIRLRETMIESVGDLRTSGAVPSSELPAMMLFRIVIGAESL